MRCPDTYLLIELLRDPTRDEELRAHLEECPDCRANFHLLQEIHEAFTPEIEVPEALDERVMASLPPPGSLRGRWPAQVLLILAAGALGSVTTAAALVAAGMVDSGSPADLLLYCAGAGIIAGLVHLRLSGSEGIRRA